MNGRTNHDIVSTYLQTWNATDGDERAALLAEHWREDARYTDPLADVAGRGPIDEVIGAAHAAFPGFVFSPVGAADAHHDQVRFQWGLGPAGAEPVVIGFDVLTLDAAGRIAQVLGFLDKIPA